MAEIIKLLMLIICFSILLVCKANTFLPKNKDKELLIGLSLRVSSYERTPFMVSTRDGGKVIRFGMVVDFFETFADYFQVRIVYVPVSPTEVAQYGTETALIHQLENDQVDIGNYLFMNILEAAKAVDMSYPLFIDDWILMQRYPNETSRLNDPIKPFTTTVWYLFVISSGVFAGMMTIIIYTRLSSSERHSQSLWVQTCRQLEYVLRIVSSEGSAIPPELKNPVFRLMIALWLLMMVVLNKSYSGTYTANLAVPKLEPTVDTLEELAASDKFRMTIDRNTDIGVKALEAEAGPFKVFGDTFRKYPELLFVHRLEAISNVVEQNCAYPAPINEVNFFVALDLKSHGGECRLSIATKPLPYYLSYAIGFQKGSPYTEIFNNKMALQVWENGFGEHLRRKYYPSVPTRCLTSGRKPGRPTPLKLNEFAGAFVLLLIGYGLAKLAFFAELIANRLNEHKKSQQQRKLINFRRSSQIERINIALDLVCTDLVDFIE